MRNTLALIIVLALGTPAVAADAMPTINNFYVEAFGGLRAPDNLRYNGTAQDLGIGTGLGAGFGVDTSIPGVSVDLDYLHSTANYSTLGTALDSQSLMLNGQYTLDLNMGIKPYAAVGLGGVNVTYKSSDSANALAYQLKLGATGPLTNQVSWFGEYRYQQAVGDVTVGSPGYPVEYASHSILGGIRLSFGDNSSSAGSTGY